MNQLGDWRKSANIWRMQNALASIEVERKRQLELWGDQNGNSGYEWVSILSEEVGELAQTINETFQKHPHHPERGGYGNIRAEAVQVAAVAAAMVEWVDYLEGLDKEAESIR